MNCSFSTSEFFLISAIEVPFLYSFIIATYRDTLLLRSSVNVYNFKGERRIAKINLLNLEVRTYSAASLIRISIAKTLLPISQDTFY